MTIFTIEMLDAMVEKYGYKNIIFKYRRYNPKTDTTEWINHKLLYWPIGHKQYLSFRPINNFIYPINDFKLSVFTTLVSAGEIQLFARTPDGDDVIFCVIEEVYTEQELIVAKLICDNLHSFQRFLT